MPDPIIPGIPDARAREIAPLFASKRLFYYQFTYREWGWIMDAKLVNRSGYVTPAGRALWERIKNDDQ
jgi:hypothetical protein